MKPCPFCGVMLTAALVDAIVDKEQKESWPRVASEAEFVLGVAG